jgi:hypothetical protein
MTLDEMIAAEVEAPPLASASERRVGWERLRGAAGGVVPPAFDVSPASVTVGWSTKLSALWAATTTKVLAVIVGGAIVGGTALSTSDEAPVGAVATAASPAAQPDPEPAPAPAVTPPVEASVPVTVPEAPAREETPAVEAEVEAVLEPADAESADPTATRKTKRRSKPKAAAGSTFHEELALIQRAQSSLASGEPKAALATLAEHARRFPRGAMNEDRLALRAVALCSSGRLEEGRAAAKRFTTRHSRSLYRDRVTEACS